MAQVPPVKGPGDGDRTEAIPSSPPSVKVSEAIPELSGDQLVPAKRPIQINMDKVANLKDLIEMLNISLTSTGFIAVDRSASVLSLNDVRIEMPRKMEQVDPVLYFTTDPLGRWCLMESKLPHAVTPFHDYRQWLVRFRHCFEKLVKDQYCYYCISPGETYHGATSMTPTDVGFDKSLYSGEYEPLRIFVSDLRKLLVVEQRDTKTRTIPILTPAFLKPLVSKMQDWICNTDEDLVVWTRKFVKRKLTVKSFDRDLKAGRTDMQWVRSAHPRKLASVMAALPRLNIISIIYAGAFAIPAVSLLDFNASTMGTNTTLRSNAADPSTWLLSVELTDTNYADIKSIITTWCLPSQVILNVDCSFSSNSLGIEFFSVLCAKLLLSCSPRCMNISRQNAERLDSVIGLYLRHQGFMIDDIYTLSLSPGAHPSKTIALFKNLLTDGWGRGWANDGCVARIPLGKDGLYDMVTSLPSYAGIRAFIPMGTSKTMDTQDRPPIFRKIQEAMASLAKEKILYVREVNVFIAYFNLLCSNYVSSVSNLNEHIRRTGETGFRLPDSTLDVLDGGPDKYDNETMERESPIICDVKLITFALLFRQMPETYLPSTLVPKQPVIESVISAELQRLFSIFKITSLKTKVDGENYTNAEVWDIILKNTISNHYASNIISLALSNNYSAFKVSDIDKFVTFDDFEASYYSTAADLVLANPEWFGMTQMVVEKLRISDTVTKEEYVTRTPKGILTTNDLPTDSKFEVAAMPRCEFFEHLERRDLLMTLRNSEGKLRLPIWYEYSDEKCFSWPAEDVPFSVTVSANDSSLDDERVSWGTFKRVYVVPDRPESFYPDKIIQSSPVRRFWFCGNFSGIRSFDPAYVNGSMMNTVKSFRKPIVFDCILNSLCGDISGSITLKPLMDCRLSN